MKKRISTLVAALLFLLIPLVLCAQNYEDLINQAQRLSRQQMFDAAREKFEQAVKINKDRLEAYLELARLEMMLQNWHAAKPWLNKIIHRDENNLEAHYQMAICDREDAIGRDQVWKRVMWRNARKHFEKVIELDSTYKDVFNEFAHLKRHQENYEEAILLCQKQLRIKPRSRAARYDIFSFYDYFLYAGGESFANPFKDLDTYHEQWLKKRTTEYDIFFLGEKYRRSGQFEKADSIFRQLLSRPLRMYKTPIRLARVRLFYQQDQPARAEQIYWEALDKLDTFDEIRFFYDDTKYIMSDQDLMISFKSIQQIRDYYHRFWNRHNPLASTSDNPRLAEHYRRLITAERDFVYIGWRLPINNPDRLGVLKFPLITSKNSKFNDKGLVYIRYGEPDDRAIQVGDGVGSNESWLYNQTGYNPKLIFHFEISEHASPGDWRLVPVPTDVRMLESRIGWDQDLDRYYLAGNQLEAQAALHELNISAGEKIPKAMNTDRHTWRKEMSSIPLYLTAARFRDQNNQNLYEIQMGVSRDQVFQQGDSVRLETGIALFDTSWNQLDKSIQQLVLSRNDSSRFSHNLLIDVIRSRTSANKLFVSTHIRDLDLARLGGHRFALDYKAFDSTRLAISDLVLAYDVEPSPSARMFSKHGLRVVPNPSSRFGRDEFVYIYYELYNLKLDKEQTRYRIEQIVEPLEKKNLVNRFLGLFGGRRSGVSVTKDQVGASSTSYEYNAFDFSELDKGRYEITIRVTDLNSGQETESSRTFELL